MLLPFTFNKIITFTTLTTTGSSRNKMSALNDTVSCIFLSCIAFDNNYYYVNNLREAQIIKEGNTFSILFL